jgi:redox-sensitive bicupin YhaK (pirin superfamily)
MAEMVFHKANTRGSVDMGRLKGNYSFSFANYMNRERMNFGVLRVLNDDTVAGGMGFGMHPHDNMEIVSIPLEGELEHSDNMGNKAVIRKGDIQVMSAGTGVRHSEYNKNKDQLVKLLQIWVIPNKRNVTPRYDQISLNVADRKNTFQQIVSPHPEDAGVWIHQNAWFHLADFDRGFAKEYNFKLKGNGLYIFMIKGEIKVNEQIIQTRDGLGIWDTEKVSITALNDSEFLLMEVPLRF